MPPTDPLPKPSPLPPKYAGFWVRFVADLIDSLGLTLLSFLLEGLVLGVIYSFWGLMGSEPLPGFWSAFDPFMVQVLNMGLYFALAIPYYVVGHQRWGTTLGKRLFHVYVVNRADLGPLTLGQSVSRYLAYFVSALPVGAGYTMAGFHPEKRALHDLIAGTVSIRR